jgi:hypothetical protein
VHVHVATLVQDEPLRRRAVHHEHRELGSPSLDPVHSRELRPGVRAEGPLQPVERHTSTVHYHAVAPRGFVAWLVQHVYGHAVPHRQARSGRGGLAHVPAALIAVSWRRRPAEVVYVPREEPNLLPALLRSGHFEASLGWSVVCVGLACHFAPAKSLGPARVSLHEHTRGTHDLILGQVQRHVERAKLAVELAGGHQWVWLPAEPVVDGDARIPVSEIQVSAASALPPGHGGVTRFPFEAHNDRIRWRQRLGQLESDDRTIRRAGVLGFHTRPVDRGSRGEPLVGVVRLRELLEADAPFPLVHRAPCRAWPERVEVLMHVQLAQRVGRVVHIGEKRTAVQHTALIVEAGVYLVVGALLPVLLRIAARRR